MDNILFRNQPSFRAFNKPFENTRDVMYKLLNELDTNVVDAHSDKPEELLCLVDPRTKQQVTRFDYDQTKQKWWKVFISTQPSILSRQEHAACLRAMVGLAQRRFVKQEDMIIWRRTTKRREEEKHAMQIFTRNYSLEFKEILYAPMKSLVTNYRIYYQHRVKRLLKELPDTMFITHLGLPKVQHCSTLNDDPATIEEISLVERKGRVMLWQDDTSDQLFDWGDVVHQRLQQLIVADAEAQLQSQQQLNNSLENNTFELPLESLIFLLTVGDYIDVPTEMLLEIDEGIDECKRIRFHSPLPSRNCGWHTNSELVQKAFDKYLSVPGRTKWLNVTNETVSLAPPYDAPEINGCRAEGATNEYKVHTFDEYMEKVLSDRTLENQDNFYKTNCALVSWKLKPSNAEMTPLNFLTTLEIPASLDECGNKLLGCNFIKLENKPRFGCEIMTKYELLKAWFQLKLLQSDTGQCLRLELETFHLLLNQRFRLKELERMLVQHYRIHVDILLGKLYEFLMLLVRVPAGKYLLRYNPKYFNKIMLCQPTKEATQNTVGLHALLQTAPTDFVFMAQENYLAVDADLCSAMHLQHQILPCAFTTNKRFLKIPPPFENNKLSNERDKMLEKAQTRKRAAQKQVNTCKKQKTQTGKGKTNAKPGQRPNTDEDMDLDKIFTL